MKGFKQWVENQEKSKLADDPDQTIDWIDKTPRPDRFLSRHAWKTGGVTPGTSGQSPTVTMSSDSPIKLHQMDLVGKLSYLLHPTEDEEYEDVEKHAGMPALDPHLRHRQDDGRHYVKTGGTPTYAAPEQLKAMMHPEIGYEMDTVEELLDRCGDLFIWLDKPCRKLAEKWIGFRSFLKPIKEAHVVNYQVNLLRMRDCEKVFPYMDKLIQAEENSDRYAGLIKAWRSFYAGWKDLAPTLKHYLMTFEKNTPKR